MILVTYLLFAMTLVAGMGLGAFLMDEHWTKKDLARIISERDGEDDE